MAPATRFVTRWPGARTANAICESLPRALTGSRSVWPSARTPSTARRQERQIETRSCHGGIEKSGATIATQSSADAPSPPSHQRAGTSCEGGATSSGSPPPSSAAAPPPPPPAPTPPRVTTRILIAPSASSGRAAPAQQPQQAPAEPAAAPRKLAPAPLTVTEQRERAELRVSRDKLQLQNLQQRLQEDEQRLSEFRRVEAEAGGSGEAVKMVFPPAS
mmetsp:Transcript_43518/g.137647  ORF Transcript_43518/g.137647 Transcript_43518/m.137647 type:complete len:218 (-) Transcript_43518:26-679(-)